MAYQFGKISVLVVEDNQPMLDITRALLGTFGVGKVVGAANGELGYKKFCENNPDLVIADWMMKPIDGITFTRMVRTDQASPNPYVPVILMTGFSEKRRVIEAREAGVTEFLAKPFNAHDLYRRLVQIIERPRQFVRANQFFGPDRRRSRNPDFAGPFQREGDKHFQQDNEETKAALKQQQRQAQETLEQLRKKAGIGKSDRFDLRPEDIDWI